MYNILIALCVLGILRGEDELIDLSGENFEYLAEHYEFLLVGFVTIDCWYYND
jgi:hypothetical protein